MHPARLMRSTRQALRSWLRKERADAELSSELAFHLDLLVLENVARGMSPSEARNAARQTLGNVASLEDQCRDQRRLTWLYDLQQDLRYALRMMRKTRGLTAVAVGSLALGIGANTAMLGVADAMLFGHLPYGDPARLVLIRTYSAHRPGWYENASLPDFLALGDQAHSFEAIGCSLADQRNLVTEKGTAPERIFGAAASPGFFEALGVRPVLGRVFTAADYHKGPPSAVILSGRLWRGRFAAAPSVLGKRILLNGAEAEVIGVLPSDFRFGEERADYWVPMQVSRTKLQAGVRYYIVVARLRKTVTLAEAQAEINRITAGLAAEFPDTHEGWSIRLQPVREALFGWTRRPFLIVESAVLIIVLLVCANLAGLLVARGSSRRREMAVRTALGAGCMRMMRQVLAESLVVSSTAGVLGLAVARGVLHLLPRIDPPPSAPHLLPLALNWHMFVLTALASLVTALSFGFAPALASFRNGIAPAVQQSEWSGALSPGHRGWYGFLVTAQIACAFLLLAGSGLLLKSFWQMAHRDLHFDPHSLQTFDLRFAPMEVLRRIGSFKGYPYMAVDPAAAASFERILDRLARIPGVESAAGISNPPVNSFLPPSLALVPRGSQTFGEVSYFLVTPYFFAAMKAELVRGREFDATDTAAAPWMAVINETAARRFWPGADAIGERFTLDTVPGDHPRQVIGIVRDIPVQTAGLDPQPVVYASYLQQPDRYLLPWATMRSQMIFVLRSAQSPAALEREVQTTIAATEPGLTPANMAPMERYTGAWLRDASYYASGMGVFAGVATLLAAMGIYGVMAYHAARRRHEVAVRTALGARPLQVILLLGKPTILFIALGLVSGFAVARSLTRFLTPHLWDVSPTDLTAFAGAFLLLALVAGMACFGALRRSLQMNLIRALRGD
jgi:putative ABC transport system permease protein